MTSYVTSVDGTQIAFDRFGQGPPVVVVSGMFCDRQTTRELAEQLAHRFGVINYDRRGRGESGDTAPYAVEREVEDLRSTDHRGRGYGVGKRPFIGCGACLERGGQRVAHHPARAARAAIRPRR